MLTNRELLEILTHARSGTRGLASVAEVVRNLADARLACGAVEVLIKEVQEAQREIARLQSEAGSFTTRLQEREQEVQRAHNLWAERGQLIDELTRTVERADEERKSMRQSVLEAALELRRAGGPAHIIAKFEGILQGA